MTVALVGVTYIMHNSAEILKSLPQSAKSKLLSARGTFCVTIQRNVVDVRRPSCVTVQRNMCGVIRPVEVFV